jgi:hypothetical protein
MKNQYAATSAGADLLSSSGPNIDVATPSTKKLRALGVLWILLTLFPLVIINYLIIEALSSEDPILNINHPVHLLGAALMPLIGWFALGSAVQRFRAASTRERYFRAGPEEVSVCLPDDYGSSTFLFSFNTCKFELPWEQIKTWYPYVSSMNGIPTERSIVFETLKGEKVKIKTYHFAENQKQIVANINQARSMPSIAPQREVSPDVEQATAKTGEFSLPPTVGELSIQFTKKKDRIKEIDLRTVPAANRVAWIETIADTMAKKMLSLCSPADGYKCSRKSYRPFKEWQDILGIRLFARRGLFEGYEIQLEPIDSECRKVAISMCPSHLISDVRKYVSLAVGAVTVVISFRWVPVIQYWLGDFSRLTPLVMVALFGLSAAAATGLLQVPVTLTRKLLIKKESEEAQKQEIRAGLQEMAI